MKTYFKILTLALAFGGFGQRAFAQTDAVSCKEILGLLKKSANQDVEQYKNEKARAQHKIERQLARSFLEDFESQKNSLEKNVFHKESCDVSLEFLSDVQSGFELEMRYTKQYSEQESQELNSVNGLPEYQKATIVFKGFTFSQDGSIQTIHPLEIGKRLGIIYRKGNMSSGG